MTYEGRWYVSATESMKEAVNLGFMAGTGFFELLNGFLVPIVERGSEVVAAATPKTSWYVVVVVLLSSFQFTLKGRRSDVSARATYPCRVRPITSRGSTSLIECGTIGGPGRAAGYRNQRCFRDSHQPDLSLFQDSGGS